MSESSDELSSVSASPAPMQDTHEAENGDGSELSELTDEEDNEGGPTTSQRVHSVPAEEPIPENKFKQPAPDKPDASDEDDEHEQEQEEPAQVPQDTDAQDPFPGNPTSPLPPAPPPPPPVAEVSDEPEEPLPKKQGTPPVKDIPNHTVEDVPSPAPSSADESSRSPSPQPVPEEEEEEEEEDEEAEEEEDEEEPEQPGSPEPQEDLPENEPGSPRENNIDDEIVPDQETPPPPTEPDHEANDPDLELEFQPAHRAEALDVLAGIEIKYALLRERLYSEKMHSLASEEGLVHDGTHPELLHLQRELSTRRDKRIDLATRRQAYETANVAKKRRLDEELVWSSWKHGRDALQTEMISDTNRKRRKLERDRRIMERPPPKRAIPVYPLEVPEPPTLHKIVHSFPFEGNDSMDDERPVTPQSPENLVYPELSTLPANEVAQDLDRIFNRPAVYDPHRYAPPYPDQINPMPIQHHGPPPPPGLEQFPPDQWNLQGRPPHSFMPLHASYPHPMMPAVGSPGIGGMPPYPHPSNVNLPNRVSQHPSMYGHGPPHVLFGPESEMSSMVHDGPHPSPPSTGSIFPSQPPYSFPPHLARSPSPTSAPRAGPSGWSEPPHHHPYSSGPKHDWRDDPNFAEDEDRGMRVDRNRRPREADLPRDYHQQVHIPPRHPPFSSVGPTATNSRLHHHHHVVHHHHGNINPPREHDPNRMMSGHNVPESQHIVGPSGMPLWQENDGRDSRLKYGVRPNSGPSPSLEAIPFSLQASSSSFNGPSSAPPDKHSSRNAWTEDPSFRRPTPSPFPLPPQGFSTIPERHGHSPSHRYATSTSQQAFPSGRPPPSRSMPMGVSPRLEQPNHAYPPPSSQASTVRPSKQPPPPHNFGGPVGPSNLPVNSKTYPQLNGPGGTSHPGEPMAHSPGIYGSQMQHNHSPVVQKSRNPELHDMDRDRERERERPMANNATVGSSVMSVPSIVDGR